MQIFVNEKTDAKKTSYSFNWKRERNSVQSEVVCVSRLVLKFLPHFISQKFCDNGRTTTTKACQIAKRWFPRRVIWFRWVLQFYAIFRLDRKMEKNELFLWPAKVNAKKYKIESTVKFWVANLRENREKKFVQKIKRNGEIAFGQRMYEKFNFPSVKQKQVTIENSRKNYWNFQKKNRIRLKHK